MRVVQIGAIGLVAAAVLLACETGALAYPNPDATYPRGVFRTDCADCHGRESHDTTGSVAATRKGPHGGYNMGTSKCGTCHYFHLAPLDGFRLLPGATIQAVCESCHDGTGGVGVYGAIEARGGTVRAAHRVEIATVVPGGDEGGGPSGGVFSGLGNTLTCSDCHSPHDWQTIAPFVGDRMRSEPTSDTVYALATNRLLKQRPTGSETTVTAYGAAWCASCHRGRATGHGDGSGLMQAHPVMAVEGEGADEYTYDRLPVVVGVESTETMIGALGQSNRGYVMPEGADGPGSRTPLQQGRGPLCQQCHEDARDIGPSERGTNPMLGAEQTFAVSVYSSPVSAESTGNPEFHVFPHESSAERFLVRPVESSHEVTVTAGHALCLNCHSLLHELPEGFDECLGCHDAGDPIDIHAGTVTGCEACHLPGEPRTAECGSCHGTDPHAEVDHTLTLVPDTMDFFTDSHLGRPRTAWLVDTVDCGIGCHADDLVTAHGSECLTCHPATWDTYEPDKGCQQSGCHVAYHGDAFVSHDPYASNPLARDYCDSCHTAGVGALLDPGFCLNCHVVPAATTALASRFSSVEATPPVTVADVQVSYVGPAYISFAITVDGEAADGRTYRRLDGGRLMAGPGVFVSEPGVHSLEFWSESLSGVYESPSRTATFTVVPDTLAPVTTSNVRSSYEATATVVLGPTDDGYLGSRYTYYRLNGGALRYGTVIEVPPPVSEMETYNLEFWSEDWSGNVEFPPKTVFFTVSSGT
ncbi:MAG: hypothetical protein RQ731_08740 [Anaerosomatales bacterium]|nr:hypothetical protein [Anaerosomatales bacterium]